MSTFRKVYTQSYRSGFYHPISILILALITLTVAVAIFANSGFFANKNVPTPSQSPQPSPKISQTDETANLKSYTNNKLRYTIKYPSSWVINNDVEMDIYIRNQNFDTKESQSKPRYLSSGYPQDYVYIRILSNVSSQEIPGYSKPLEWYRDLASKKGKVNDAEGTLDLKTVSNFSLDGQQTIVVKSSSDEVTALILTPVGEDVHRIMVSPYEKFNSKEVKEILSTFKFLN